MQSKVFYYPLIIKEVYLDTFGHMNNATYLTLFEEARWDLIAKSGYSLQKIQETKLGPTILEIKLSFQRELTVRQEIVIETQLLSYEKKIGKIAQRMVRQGEVCCTAEFVIALFDMEKRKLVPPTPEWLAALGL